MVMINCPRCQIRIPVNPRDQDVVHKCRSGVPALDNEDVLIIGSWEDFTGSDSINKNQVRYAPLANNLWGTRAWVEAQTNTERTERGKKKSIYRTRKHLEFINIKDRIKQQKMR